jgi:hypothetical protein
VRELLAERAHAAVTAHTGTVWAVAVGQLDGRPIAVTGSVDRTLRVWDRHDAVVVHVDRTGFFARRNRELRTPAGRRKVTGQTVQNSLPSGSWSTTA